MTPPQEEFDLFGGPAAVPAPEANAIAESPTPATMAANTPELPPPPSPLSVGELTRAIRAVLEDEIGDVWVAGEVSNHRRQASGHHYFTLKDADAQIACVLFRGAAARAGATRIADGAQLEIKGELSVYESRGQYQIIVRSVAERGRGRLHERFEALKRKLEAEGLFDPAGKKPLPQFPRRVALVTSPTGAAIRDMLDVLGRRAPWIEVLVLPVRVQGDGAAREIANALGRLDAWVSEGSLAADAVLVGRGGGSLEDLWAFNEEAVARAIAACRLPVVSAVGHETDFTIADFVADVRAPTPSAAAEMVSPSGADLLHRLAQLRRALDRQVAGRLRVARLELAELQAAGLRRETVRRIEDASLVLDDLAQCLHLAIREALHARRLVVDQARQTLRRLEPRSFLQLLGADIALLRQRLAATTQRDLDTRSSQLERLSAQLRLLGPQSTLERGYTLTLDTSGRLVTSAKSPTPGSRLVTRFKDGDIPSLVLKQNAATAPPES